MTVTPNPNMPPGTILFVSPRKVISRDFQFAAEGMQVSTVYEPEDEWLKRCGAITNLPEPQL